MITEHRPMVGKMSATPEKNPEKVELIDAKFRIRNSVRNNTTSEERENRIARDSEQPERFSVGAKD